jgi:hypothetical protein
MRAMSMFFQQVQIVWWHVDLAYYLIKPGLLCALFIMHNGS